MTDATPPASVTRQKVAPEARTEWLLRFATDGRQTFATGAETLVRLPDSCCVHANRECAVRVTIRQQDPWDQAPRSGTAWRREG
jgi:hypothetical protein